MPEELTNPEDADVQCERHTYEPTYCYNMNVDPELDLHMAAQIQEERLEFQFHEFREELAEKSTPRVDGVKGTDALETLG